MRFGGYVDVGLHMIWSLVHVGGEANDFSRRKFVADGQQLHDLPLEILDVLVQIVLTREQELYGTARALHRLAAPLVLAEGLQQAQRSELQVGKWCMQQIHDVIHLLSAGKALIPVLQNDTANIKGKEGQ